MLDFDRRLRFLLEYSASYIVAREWSVLGRGAREAVPDPGGVLGNEEVEIQ